MSSAGGRVVGVMMLAASAVACGPLEGAPEAEGGGAGGEIELVDSPLLASGCAQLTPNHSGPVVSTGAPPSYPDKQYNSPYGFPTNRAGCGTFWSAKATGNHHLWGGVRVVISAIPSEINPYCSNVATSSSTYVAYEIWARTSYSGIWKRLRYQDALPACPYANNFVNWTFRDTCVWEPDGESCIADDFGEDYVVTVRLYRLGVGTTITNVRVNATVITSFGFL